jgi:small redox-active disulfide protein 2
VKIAVLGTGCPKCSQVAANAEKALAESGLDGEIIKVTDLNDIMSYGIMVTPGLAIDGEVKVVGKVPTVEEIKALLG